MSDVDPPIDPGVPPEVLTAIQQLTAPPDLYLVQVGPTAREWTTEPNAHGAWPVGSASFALLQSATSNGNGTVTIADVHYWLSPRDGAAVLVVA